MPCVNTSPFIEHTMSERIYCYLLHKITANWALRNKHKASPKDKPENHEERTCIIILLISDRRYKPCEENITNASDSNLLILGCSLGSRHNSESPEGSGCIPVACDHLHMDSYTAQSLQNTTRQLCQLQATPLAQPLPQNWRTDAQVKTMGHLTWQSCPW